MRSPGCDGATVVLSAAGTSRLAGPPRPRECGGWTKGPQRQQRQPTRERHSPLQARLGERRAIWGVPPLGRGCSSSNGTSSNSPSGEGVPANGSTNVAQTGRASRITGSTKEQAERLGTALKEARWFSEICGCGGLGSQRRNALREQVHRADQGAIVVATTRGTVHAGSSEVRVRDCRRAKSHQSTKN